MVIGSEFWVRHLAFRDCLREHADAAIAYDALKRQLCVRCSKEEDTEAKSPFIERILSMALRHDGPLADVQQLNAS